MTKKLKIPKEELDKITEEHKHIAFHFGMSEWNPLGNQDIFRSIQEDIFNYFLRRKHKLNKNQTEMLDNALSKTQAVSIIEDFTEKQAREK